MLKYILPLLFLFPLIGTTQTDTTNNEKWEKVETMPEFQGGQTELFKYLGNNIKYPLYCRNNGIQGKVYVSFVILKDGSLDSIKVSKEVHPLLDAHAIEIIKAMPKWTPGKINDEAVNVSYTLPINFIVHNSGSGSDNRTKGIKYFNEGKYESSIYYLSKIIKVNKNDASLFYYRGMAYHKDGNTKKAIKDLEKAKEFGSKEAEEYLKTIE